MSEESLGETINKEKMESGYNQKVTEGLRAEAPIYQLNRYHNEQREIENNNDFAGISQEMKQR